MKQIKSFKNLLMIFALVLASVMTITQERKPQRLQKTTSRRFQ